MEEELQREKQEIREKVDAKYPRINTNNFPGLNQVRETPDFPNEPTGVLREANLYENKLTELRQKISKIQNATLDARNAFS